MLITLSKFSDKPVTLSCQRRDGSLTWQSYGNHSGFFPIHDLTHYVVETQLSYRNAFFGMVSAGRDLNSFGPGEATHFHAEAFYAEMLAGLLTCADGRDSILPFGVIMDTIHGQVQKLGIPPISLTEDDLIRIRDQAAELETRWQLLPSGEKLTLEFPF
jgi:hypothetical protein